jgi:hypothetical protein
VERAGVRRADAEVLGMRLRTLVGMVCAALLAPPAALAQRFLLAQPVAIASHTLPPGPVARLAPADLATWRSGYWWHGWRGGRAGWWWCAGGYWYWFASPIYPYPTSVPVAVVGGGNPAPRAVWWRCDNPAGYYPYVRGCWHWRAAPPKSGPTYPPPR